MSVEEALRKLEEFRKERERAYLQQKGLIQGFRLRKLAPIQIGIVGIFEMMIDESQKVWNEITNACKQQIHTNQKISNLEKRIEELENNILQLRETIDKLFQAK